MRGPSEQLSAGSTTGSRMSAARRPRGGEGGSNEEEQASPQLNGGGERERSGSRRGRKRVTSLRGVPGDKVARPRQNGSSSQVRFVCSRLVVKCAESDDWWVKVIFRLEFNRR